MDMSTAAIHEFASQRELILIEENHTVVAALRKIVEKRVNGLGVVRASFPPLAALLPRFRSLLV
jgi:CBS domain-containing protein